jgi:CBS domain-containing protein
MNVDMMETLKELLRTKTQRRHIISIAPDARVYDALVIMVHENVSALLVLEGEALVGIITDRDYARKVILKGRSSLTTSVREIMTERVMCVDASQSPEACMALMTEKRIRHLPVLEGGKLIGLISIGDLVKGVIADKDFTIEQLIQYIHH